MFRARTKLRPAGTQPHPHVRSVRHILWPVLVQLFYDYAANTKVNGLYYLRRGKTSGYLRALWAAIPLTILLFGAYLVYQLARNFNAVPTLMIIDRPRPTSAVPFPAITFCHPQTVLDYKARQFVRDLRQLPGNISADQVLAALPALGMFVENQWFAAGAEPAVQDLQLIDLVLAANNYTVAVAVRQLGLSCRDFIKVCAWSKVEFDCFQSNRTAGGADSEHLSFTATISYLGMCCSFNYHPANASYEAFRSPTFGTRGGLSIIGSGYPQVADGKSGVLFSSGFMMLLHHPSDYPVEGNQMNLVEIGAVTSVAVYPTLTHSSAEVLALPQRSRRCVLDGELGPDEYRQPSCAVGCTRNFIYRVCGCHPFHVPRPKGWRAAVGGDGVAGKEAEVAGGGDGWWRDCTAVDAACFAKHYYDIKRAKCEYCLPSCIDINYDSHGFSNLYNLRNNSYNITPMYRKINVTELQFTAHIYLANQVVRVQKQIIVLSAINLLSNFGGVFNLCLGISFLSVIELLVYVAVKLPQNLRVAYSRAQLNRM